MSKINGRFYFKQTASGNLLGEFSNREKSCVTSFGETANRVGAGIPHRSPLPHFAGNYITVWYESKSQGCMLANLAITLKPGSTTIFSLIWTESGSEKRIFEGEAMLYDDSLVGDYNSTP